MRRMLEQKSIDWIKSLKEYIAQEGNKTEIGCDLEVDGNIIVNGADNIVDKDGNKLIVGGGGGNKVAFVNHFGSNITIKYKRFSEQDDSTTIPEETMVIPPDEEMHIIENVANFSCVGDAESGYYPNVYCGSLLQDLGEGQCQPLTAGTSDWEPSTDQILVPLTAFVGISLWF